MKRIIMILLTVLFITLSLPNVAYATSGAIGITTEFDDLEGDGKYLGSDYRDNYNLDTKKLGMTDVADKAFHGLGNGVFYLIRFTGFLVSAVFYFSLDFDLAKLLAPLINPIQETMRNNVFLPLFQLVLVAALVMAVMKFVRRDFIGVMEQFGKIIFILILSILVVRDSANFLTYSNNITKGVAVSILTSVSGSDVSSSTNDYAATAAGTLWVSMVHEPWKSLQFDGYDYTEEDVEAFLSESDEEVRQTMVEDIREDHKTAFRSSALGPRIFIGFIIFLTTLIKGVIYMLVGVLQIFFQVMAVFYVMLAPLVLLISLIPGFDFDFLAIWVKKIFETQIAVLLLTFIMGLMILIDSTLQTFSGGWGWFVTLIIQIVMSVGMFLNRDKILGMLNTAHRNMRYPKRAMHEFRNSGNPYQYIQKIIRDGGSGPTTSRSTISRPQKNIAGDQKLRADTSEREPDRPRPNTQKNEPPNTYDTGIIGQSQFLAPQETPNWRDIWNQSDRPTAAEEKRKRNSAPRIKQGEGTDIDINARIKVNKRPLVTTISGDIDAEARQKGRTVRVTGEGEARKNMITKNVDASGRADIEAVQELKDGGTARVYVEGEGETTIKPKPKRPVTSQEEAGRSQSRPASSNKENPRQEAGRTSQGRPVTSDKENPRQEAGRTSQGRPVTSDKENPHQEAGRTSQGRPVTSDKENPRQEAGRTSQGRPVTSDKENPRQEAGRASQSHPVSSDKERPQQEAKKTSQSRPVSHKKEKTNRGTKKASQNRPASGEKGK